jgi:hypothetical protein
MDVTLEFISDKRSWQIFNEAARSELGIDGDTFIKKWDNGEFADDANPDVMMVAMLRPSGS